MSVLESLLGGEPIDPMVASRLQWILRSQGGETGGKLADKLGEDAGEAEPEPEPEPEGGQQPQA